MMPDYDDAYTILDWLDAVNALTDVDLANDDDEGVEWENEDELDGEGDEDDADLCR